ncbi:MAG TPA: M24 family metallopeptidase [Gemmatales bacterium]|nr:M24 family metallopeptidase [Gemmatales bacterium]
MFDLKAVQQAIADQGFDGWLLCDFRGSNVLAQRIVGISPEKSGSRRWAYFVPVKGEPRKLVHRIEPGALDHLPGSDKTVYLPWQQYEAGMQHLVGSARKVAMEYSPRNAIPYVSKVDAGTIELIRSFGAEVVSSGDLIQCFEAVWDDEQEKTHFEAAKLTDAAYAVTWKYIAESIRQKGQVTEKQVQDRIMAYFETNGMMTYSPPIVGVNAHSGDPHYDTGNAPIKENDFVLVDLWAKMKKPRAVYSDLTRVGFVGKTVPEKYTKIFTIVAAARDAAIALVQDRFASNKVVHGWEVDQAARDVITKAGYGEYFVHRTGHSIGQETHGNGANIDNLETQDQRKIMRRTCFSIEPGIYLPEFGVRSEVNVYVDGEGKVHVTGGELQRAVVEILK